MFDIYKKKPLRSWLSSQALGSNTANSIAKSRLVFKLTMVATPSILFDWALSDANG